MDKIEYFKKNKYVVVENLVSPDVINFLYNYFILKGCTNREFNDSSEADKQTYNDFLKGSYNDLAAETLLSQLDKTLSHIVQKNLCPTYSYSRLYVTGEELKVHSDRPACQYSVTVNIGGDPWSIYYGILDPSSKDGVLYNGKKVKILNEITLKPGEGAVYMGEELLHWRDPFEGDHCVQTFLHYVDEDDENYKNQKYDGRHNIGFIKKVE